MTAFYIAYVETRNFSFEGVGNNEDQAREAITKAFFKHRQQYDCEYSWIDEVSRDIAVRCVKTGAGYRDKELIE